MEASVFWPLFFGAICRRANARPLPDSARARRPGRGLRGGPSPWIRPTNSLQYRLWPRSPPAFLPVLYRIRIGTLLVDTFPGRPTVSAHTQKHYQIRQVPSEASSFTHPPAAPRCASPRAKRLSSTMGMIMTCVSCRRRRHGCGACGFFLRSSSLRR